MPKVFRLRLFRRIQMKQVSKIMWGFVLVCFGVVYALKVLDIVDIDLFFKGWWTLIIIIPSFISLFADRDKTGGIIGLLVGIVLLLWRQGLVDIEMMLKLGIPAIIIVVGLELIFHNAFNKTANEAIRNLRGGNGTGRSVSAVFSTRNDDCSNQNFEGSTYTAIFGTVNSDVTNAVFSGDVLIKVHNVLGTVNITVPEGVNVVVRSHSLFGGIINRIPENSENTVTIYVEGFCLLGNVEVK